MQNIHCKQRQDTREAVRAGLKFDFQMKQVKFIFLLAAMVALSVGFSSCSSDDNLLEGTTWVFEGQIVEGGITMTGRNTITFTSGSAGAMAAYVVEFLPIAITIPFTYVFNDPNITITMALPDKLGGGTSVLTGEIRDSRMTLVGDEERVFIRQ